MIDYAMMLQELTFSAVDTVECAMIAIINDTDVECDDVFSVSLSIPGSDSRIILDAERTMGTVTIMPDPADGESICNV